MAPKRKEPEKAAPRTEAPNSEDDMEIEVSVEDLTEQCERVLGKETQAEVLRLYSMRSTFQRIAWLTDSGKRVKSLAIRLVTCETMYKCRQGQALVALIIAAHVPDGIAALKQFIADTSESHLLDGAGEALLRAWQRSQGESRAQLEEALRSLMKLAVTCNIEAAERLRRVLHCLHTNKQVPGIAETVARLYGPVLWRHFQVANWEVRFNAVALLSAAFPILSADCDNITAEAEISRQLLKMQEAMLDKDESVRRVAVHGVIRVLKDLYSMLPAEWISRLLSTLVEKCAFDVSVPLRRASLAGLDTLLAENGLTHGGVLMVLPHLKPLLHDPHPSVRVEFLRLYQRCSSMARFDVKKLADLEGLIQRMAFERDLFLNKTKNKTVCETLAEILWSGAVSDELGRQVEIVDQILAKDVFGCFGILRFFRGRGWRLQKTKLSYALLSSFAADKRTADPRLQRARLLAVAEMLDSLGNSLVGSEDAHDIRLRQFFYGHITSAFFMENLGDGFDSELLEVLRFLTFGEEEAELFEQIRSRVDNDLPALYLLADEWNLIDAFLKARLSQLEQLAVAPTQRNGNHIPKVLEALTDVLSLDKASLTAQIAVSCQRIMASYEKGLQRYLELPEPCLAVFGFALNAFALHGDDAGLFSGLARKLVNSKAPDTSSWAAVLLEIGACAIRRHTARGFEEFVPQLFRLISSDDPSSLRILSRLCDAPEIPEDAVVSCLECLLEKQASDEASDGKSEKALAKKLVTRIGRKAEIAIKQELDAHPLVKALRSALQSKTSKDSVLELVS